MRIAKWAMRAGEPGLRLTVIAVLVMVLLVSQLVLVVGGSVTAHREVERALEHSLDDVLDASQAHIERSTTAVLETVVTLDLVLEGHDGAEPELIEVLVNELKRQDAVEAVSLTHPDGSHVRVSRGLSHLGFTALVVTVHDDGSLASVVIDYDRDLRALRSSLSNLDPGPFVSRLFTAAAQSESPVWVDPVEDPLTGAVEWWAAGAVRDENGDEVGVAAAMLSRSELTSGLRAASAGIDGDLVLWSGESVVAAVRDGEPLVSGIGTSVSSSHVIAGTVQAQEAVDADAWTRAGDLVTVERPFSSATLDWSLYVSATETSLSRGYSSLATTVTLVLGLLVPLTLALAYLLAAMWKPLTMMREGSQRDALTGLSNRRHLEQRAHRLLRAAYLGGRDVALAVLDIDNFKRLNDTEGHLAGDDALETVGAVLASEVRATDLAVRWGGDEFVVMLLMGTGESPAEIVERIRSRMEEALHARFARVQDLGVTSGYAVSNAAGETFGELFARADAALVAGKAVTKGATYGPAAASAAAP